MFEQIFSSPTLLAILAIWELTWKGFALWKSAGLKQPVWFVCLLVFNTLGILPILYLFVFSKMKFDSKKQQKKSKK